MSVFLNIELSNLWRRHRRARRHSHRRRIRAKTVTLAHHSQTIQDIQMKLGTHVARDNMHMYSKGHNSDFNIY